MAKMRSVLITGTSTGIGRACALRLDREGFQVFAGVRKKRDGEALQKASTGNVIPVIIDVTDEKTVSSAFKFISKTTGGELYGLMNNAGVGSGGFMEINPMTVVRSIIETNLIGMFTVIRAFLPLLRRSKGRIVNTGSLFGLTALPGFSAYSASKFGVEGLSNSIRLELRPFGITVSVLEPGAIATEIWRKGEESWSKACSKTDPGLLKIYENFIKSHEKYSAKRKYLQPEAVAEYVYHAFTAKKPRRHYLIGKDAKFLMLFESLPEGLRDWIFYRMIYS